MRGLNFTRRQALGLIAGTGTALLAQTTFPSRVLAATTPTDSKLAGLQSSIQGIVISKGSPTYDQARASMVWNKRVAQLRSPDAIVQVASVDDVAAAVRYARTNRLKVAIRGSGHNYNGAVLRDGGLLLDLSRLKTIEIDANQRRASIQPAAKGGELATALATHDLAFPVGHCSDVALSGYVLSGGFGWNFGEWGAACMSVTGIELVTAAGDLVYADDKHNFDLMWAARGAGPGFFAVATRYDVVLYQMPAAARTFAVTFDMASASVLAKWLPEAIQSVHPTAEVVCAIGPIDATGTPVIAISATAFGSSDAEAAARIASLQSFPAGATLVGDPIAEPVTFDKLSQLTDVGFPNGKRMAGDQLWSEASVGDLMTAVQHLASAAPPAPSAIVIVSLGGSLHTAPMPSLEQAALSKGGGTFVGAYAFWDDPAQDAASRTWVRSVISAAERYGTGSYVGEADLAVGANRARECFAPAAWDRLVALRKQYDPENRFFSYLTEA